MHGPRTPPSSDHAADQDTAGRRVLAPATSRRAVLRAAGTGALALGAGVGVGAAASGGRTDGATGAGGGAGGDAPGPTQSVEPLGTLDLAGAREAVVGEDGETAFVAVNDGFATVDLADPANPEPLAEVRGIPETRSRDLQSVHDLKVDGDRVVVPGPAQSGDLRGFQLFDVSDPADPVPVGDFYETRFRIHNCAFDDGVVYLTGNFTGGVNELVAVDVADDDPTEAGRWSLLDHDDAWANVPLLHWVLHDVSVQDGVAYCAYWDAGAWLVDVSDPSAPSYVGHAADYTRSELLERTGGSGSNAEYLQPPGNAHFVTVDDEATLMGVGVESWDATPDDPDSGGPGGITLWDVSDPTAPERLTTIEPNPAEDESYASGTWTTAHNFELRNGVAYTSWYQDGVRVFDVSDPAAPTELASWRDRDEAAFWTARVATPGETFVASSAADLPNNAPTADRLYVFPDRWGDPGGGTTNPTPTATPADPDPTTGTPTPTPTATATGTSTRTPTGTAPPDGDESDGGGLDGFGVGVAAAALGLGVGAWRRLRREDR